MDMHPYFLRPEATLREAFKTIENNRGNIALIVDPDDKLMGLVTDGNVRRGLLNGLDLDAKVLNVMTEKMIFLKSSLHSLKATAEALMIKHDIQQIPVINEKGIVIDLLLRKDFNNHFISQLPYVVIMAGGLGSRLLPLTKETPKPMLKIGETPMMEIVLSQCIRSGLKNFYFAVNHLKDQIIEYFGDGTKWGVSIKYLEEEQPLGTAGALKLLPNNLDKPLLVLNGDVLTDLNINNLIKFHIEHDSLATICVREYLESIPFGVVSLDGEKVLEIKEKPSFKHYVNGGVYVLNPEITKLISPGLKVDMPDLINFARGENYKISAYPIHEYWLDVGIPETFKQAKKDWKDL
ncbi:MAG: nucleotidyltransferase family protein [Prochlorococcus marinus CUG1438]|nr:nucleotidyltransferase family protein [Prochlorococcus marinus CUG1438]